MQQLSSHKPANCLNAAACQHTYHKVICLIIVNKMTSYILLGWVIEMLKNEQPAVLFSPSKYYEVTFSIPKQKLNFLVYFFTLLLFCKIFMLLLINTF